MRGGRIAPIPFVVLSILGFAAGCKTPSSRPAVEPPPADFQATTIDYVESDAFDEIFEAALLRQDPVIMVRTGFSKPDWGPRLNAWIAAWNRGGKVDGRTARGQAPIPAIVVDGESIREFRLLIQSLMDRVEDVAREGSAWWKEERTRSRRVALLKPYNLRFHMADNNTIQLVFFNGDYARYYQAYMRTLTHEDQRQEPWSRTFECTRCRRLREGKGTESLSVTD